MKKGFYRTEIRVKEGAEAPDGVTKHAYSSEDYEHVCEWVPYAAEELAAMEAEEAAKRAQEAREAVLDAIVDAIAANGAAGLLTALAGLRTECAGHIEKLNEARERLAKLGGGE